MAIVKRVVKGSPLTYAEIDNNFDELATASHTHSNATVLNSTTASFTTAQETKLSNTSGTNTGDETTATIKSKLSITTLSGSNTGDQDLSGYTTLTGSQTLTNKTLTAPVISTISNTGTLTLPTSTGTLALTSQITSGSTKVLYLSTQGILSDASLAVGSTTFGTDQTSAIQTILNLAQTAPIKIIWDCKVSVTGLAWYSNTSIEVLEGCGAILRNNSNKPMWRNANKSFNPAVISDTNFSLKGGIWNMNNYNSGLSPANEKYNNTNGLVSAFVFYGTKFTRLENITIIKHRDYAIHQINSHNQVVKNFYIDATERYSSEFNSDGIHADGNCSDITWRDGYIAGWDDCIALNADDVWDLAALSTFYGSAACGPISNVTIDNVHINSPLFGIRILSAVSRVDNIKISRVYGNTTNYGCVISNYQQGQDTGDYPDGFTGNGNFGTIEIDGYAVESAYGTEGENTSGANILVSGNIDKLKFTNLVRKSTNGNYWPTFKFFNSPCIVKNFILDGYDFYSSSATAATDHIILTGGATIQKLKISNVSIDRAGSSQTGALVKATSSTITTANFNDIAVNNITNIFSAVTPVALPNISAANIRHTNAGSGASFSIPATYTVADIVASNYYGSLLISATGTFTTQHGDAFTAVADVAVPVLSTATVEDANKDKIVLTYNEALLTTPLPSTSDFSVSGGKTVSTVAISGSTVTLTVNSAYAYGATITVSYTGGTNKIKDLAGNIAANLSSQSVTNNIAGGTNLITAPSVLSDAFWTKNGSTITDNATTAVDGTTTADKMLATAVAGHHQIAHTFTKAAASLTYVLQFDIKTSELNEVVVDLAEGANGIFEQWQASGNTNSNSGTYGSGFTSGTKSITSAANGNSHVSMTVTTNSATSLELYIGMMSGGTNSFTGTGTNGLYLSNISLVQQ